MPGTDTTSITTDNDGKALDAALDPDNLTEVDWPDEPKAPTTPERAEVAQAQQPRRKRTDLEKATDTYELALRRYLRACRVRDAAEAAYDEAADQVGPAAAALRYAMAHPALAGRFGEDNYDEPDTAK
jgi:Arc/MetJ family transcription regulator